MHVELASKTKTCLHHMINNQSKPKQLFVRETIAKFFLEAKSTQESQHNNFLKKQSSLWELGMQCKGEFII